MKVRPQGGIPRALLSILTASFTAATCLAGDSAPDTGPTGQTVTIPARVPAYSLAPPHELKGYFPQGASLEVVEAAGTGFLRVRFSTADGRVIEGLCRAEHLGLPGHIAAEGSSPEIREAPGTVYKERNWLEDAAGYKEALRLQSRFGVPLLLYFYADWNPESQLADRELLDTSDFKNKTKHIIKVRINPEHGDDEGKLAAKLGVYSYPSTLIVDKPHAEPRKVRLVRKVFGRFKADDVEHALAKILAGSQPAPATNAPPAAATNVQEQVNE
ncbi:MAG: hypothetical protein JXB04_11705 [Kiritimatiellae bacterium]|nr:hypothetical protein [Kiritimatiellia bacterium]